MKISSTERVAILVTGLVIAFFAGFYFHSTLSGGGVMVETERTVVAPAARRETGVGESTPVQTPEPAASSMPLEALEPAENTDAPVRSLGGALLDLNSATLEELQTLPHIGPVLAQRIVDYRTEHGGFQSVSELMEIKGIGEKIYEAIAEQVKAG